MNPPADARGAGCGRPVLWLLLLAVTAFSLAVMLHRGPLGQAADSRDSSPLAVLLGEGRKMVANHFFVKADVYFHSGYYPTIFDNREAYQTPHMAEDADAMEGRNQGDEHGFLGPPLDWIERLGRQFYIGKHTHLDEGGADGQGTGLEREMLPWLRLAAELNQQDVRTYMVAAYWLRQRMNKPREAEAFLREGLRHNPRSYEILFELGRIQAETHGDTDRARNIWETALRWWEEQQAGKPEPDLFLRANLLGQLARLEQRAGRYTRAIEHFQALKVISSSPQTVEEQIQECRAALRAQPAPATP
jgi:tetratricopeptide (TPR) repeat protein